MKPNKRRRKGVVMKRLVFFREIAVGESYPGCFVNSPLMLLF